MIKSTTAHLFHVGDSRIYLFRGHDLEQLTNDHRIQMLGEQEYLGRAMGADYRLDIDYKMVTIEQGEQFLITTDSIQ